MFVYFSILIHLLAVLQKEDESCNLEEQKYNSDIQRKNILAPISSKVYPTANSTLSTNNEPAKNLNHFKDTSVDKEIEKEMLVYQII